MSDEARSGDGGVIRRRALRVALVVAGVGFSAGLYPLIRLWPEGFRWNPGQPAYEHMIVAIYAVLGIFLIRAAFAPHAHLSLIWFTVWSSLAHAGVMTLHAVADPSARGHLIGDVPTLVIVAAVLALLAPRRGGVSEEESRGAG